MPYSGAFGWRACTIKLDQLVQYIVEDVGNIMVLLFTNDEGVVPGSSTADFAEAGFPGYAPRNISAGWEFATVVGDSYAEKVRSELVTWTNTGTGSATFRGYVVYIEDEDEILWGENFGEAVTLEPGQEFTLRVRIRDRSAVIP